MATCAASAVVWVCAAALCLAAAPTTAADAGAALGGPGERDVFAELTALDAPALAAATGGFRVGNLEIGMGAIVRTMIADGGAGDGGVIASQDYALEPGMSAQPFRLDVPGTTVSGLGLATVIENTQSNRAISRQLTLNVEIAGLASAVRAAAAARAIGAAGPSPRFR